MRFRLFLLLPFLVCCNLSYAGLFSDDEARQQIAIQQKKIGELYDQERALEKRIKRFEELLDNQALIELNNQVETLKLDINKLLVQIEILTNENESLQKRQKDFYIDLDTRLRRTEQLNVSAVTESDATSSPPLAAKSPSSINVGSAETAENRAYEIAHSQFRNGEYQDAIVKFRDFLKNYPESQRVPSTHYWIGNSYYALRDFKSAINAQQKLVNTFPSNVKIPDALLNIASSQQEMNDGASAKKTLENIISKYPTSDAAEKAKKRIVRKK